MGKRVYVVLRSACTDLVLALEREENFTVHVVSGKYLQTKNSGSNPLGLHIRIMLFT